MTRMAAPALLGCLLAGTVASAQHGSFARCPSHVLDAKTQIARTTSGVDVVVVGGDARKVAEIRRRARSVVEAARAGTGELGDLEGCVVVVRNASVTAVDIELGTKISVRAAKTADVQELQSETEKRHQRDLAALARPHAVLLVDAKTNAEVWVDGIDSGYQTPTDGILLPPGRHEVAVHDDFRPTAATVVEIGQNETRRLYFSLARD